MRYFCHESFEGLATLGMLTASAMFISSFDNVLVLDSNNYSAH